MFLPLCCCQCWCLCFALLRCIKEKNTTTVQSNRNNARTHPAHRFFIQDCCMKKNFLRNYHVNYFHKQVRQLTQIRYLLKSNSGSIQVRSVCNHFFALFQNFPISQLLFSKNLKSLQDFFSYFKIWQRNRKIFIIRYKMSQADLAIVLAKRPLVFTFYF